MIAYVALAYLAGYLAGYCLIGWWAAKREVPRTWELAWKEHANEGHFWDSWRLSFVKSRLTVTFLFWPVVLPARALNGKINSKLVESDPVETKKKLREQRRYIEQLERELGMGK